MNDLDEKLKQIGLENADDGGDIYYSVYAEKMIPQIKQAFADEGYVKMPEIHEIKGKLELQNTPKSENPFMTGQVWYDRFEKELAGKLFPFSNSTDNDVINAVNQCKEAAKKAAGIE